MDNLLDTHNPGANPGQFQKGHAPTAGSFKKGGDARICKTGSRELTELRRRFEHELYQELVQQLPPKRAVELLVKAVEAKERWALILYFNKVAPDTIKFDVTKTDVQLQLRAQIEQLEQLPPEILNELIESRKRFDAAVERARQLAAPGSLGDSETEARIIDVAPEVRPPLLLAPGAGQ